MVMFCLLKCFMLPCIVAILVVYVKYSSSQGTSPEIDDKNTTEMMLRKISNLERDVKRLKTFETELRHAFPRALQLNKRSVQDVENVAFSISDNQYLTGVHAGLTFKLKNVLLNDGVAYNIHTGVFTCPVNGVYLFNYVFTSENSGELRVGLKVDSGTKIEGVADVEPGVSGLFDTEGGNFVILRLTAGQSVWLEFLTSGQEGDSTHETFASFAGVLLY